MDYNPEYGLKDSGQREDFETGSRRDTREGKGRYDLISPRFTTRLAKVLEKGAIKYGERNWEKGQPLGRYLDSALRHINSVQRGLHDEDHAAQAAWNLQAFIHTAELIAEGKLPASLDDIGYLPVLELAGEDAEAEPEKASPADYEPVSYQVTLADRMRAFLAGGTVPIERVFAFYKFRGYSPQEVFNTAHTQVGVVFSKDADGNSCWSLPEEK